AKRLAALFGYSLADLGDFSPTTPEHLPAECRSLLAHTGHMTVTLEAFHGTLVDVRVLKERLDEASYAREILLTRQSDGASVQDGLVRIGLADLPAEVREDIRAKQTPLGRVLIRHGLLRDVEVLSLWRIAPGEMLTGHFGSGDVFGRSAQILVDQRPTVQLLEVVRV
ncbi:MAG: hypothetical protein AAGB00_13155, partial [Planctomycetota bacterium]